jgi:hypothetical protein
VIKKKELKREERVCPNLQKKDDNRSVRFIEEDFHQLG